MEDDVMDRHISDRKLESLIRKLEATANKFEKEPGMEDGDEYDCGDMNSAIERSYHEVVDEIRRAIRDVKAEYA